MFVFVFTVLALAEFIVTVGEENTCDIRDLKSLFVKMLTTENSMNVKIEESTNAFLTELKVIKQQATQQDNAVTLLQANYIETIKQINETENAITAKTEESTNAFLTELNVIKQQVSQQDTEVTSLKANYVQIIQQINETVQAENKEIERRLDEIVQNMTELATKLDILLTATACLISSCKKVPNYSGTYNIYPGDKCNRMAVHCDQTTDGGGWIVIQRRKDGSVDFERDWADYKSGFGDLEGEFWLGNDNIHALTAAGFNELRVDMEDFYGNLRYAKYSNFSIKSESDKYTLTVSGYSGDAGDSLNRHNGMAFSTRDQDNDISSGNCAVSYRGAWWYENCYSSNLNGYYHANISTYGTAVRWSTWNQPPYTLKFVEMKIR